MMNQQLKQVFRTFAEGQGRLTVLTGAGISAESNIPTFRGPEGYWTVGSRNYHPQEMATNQMFRRNPDEVWKWYLYRMNVCAAAQPNPGHTALVAMEHHFGDRFTLITQNVDGLHLLAGNSLDRTYHIHGNIFFMRCFAECSHTLYPMPDSFRGRPKDQYLTDPERALLVCPRCGERTRPHVLWFDEMYNEIFFRFESSLRAAAETDLLLIVGTSGVTNLPNQVAWTVAKHGGMIVDINVEENVFSELARRSSGHFIQSSSSRILPEILALFREGEGG